MFVECLVESANGIEFEYPDGLALSLFMYQDFQLCTDLAGFSIHNDLHE